jgi:TonB family protein
MKIIKKNFLSRFLLTTLGILTFQGIHAQSKLSMEVLEPGNEGLFQRDAAKNRVVTDAAELEVVGKVADPLIDFVLLKHGGKEFPLYPVEGAFRFKVSLDKGVTPVEVVLFDGTLRSERLEMVRLAPFRLESVREVRANGDSAELSAGDPSAALKTYSARVPSVEVVLQPGEPRQTQLRVVDQLGNPVLVEERSGMAVVSYSLREGANTLSVRSLYEDRVYDEVQIAFELGDVMVFEFDAEKLGKDWWSKAPSTNRVQTSATAVPLRGRIESLSEGKVTVTAGSKSFPVDVKSHEFSFSAPLEPGKVNTIKVNAESSGQSFFKFVEIEQVPASVQWQNIREGRINGPRVEDGAALSRQGNTALRTRSPVLRLVGRASYVGGGIASLTNQATGQRVGLSQPGLFQADLSLKAGSNTLVWGLGEGDAFVQVDSFEVVLDNPVELESLNGRPVSGDVQALTVPELNLVGKVPALARGVVDLKVGERTLTLQVVEGRFKSDSAIPLQPGRNTRVVVSANVGDQVFSQTIEVSAPEAKPTATPTPTATANDAKKNTPPVPVKVVDPRPVVDPDTDEAQTGSVTIQFTVDKKGSVKRTSVWVTQSTNPLLDDAAVETVIQWKFEPATVNGEPVDKQTRVTLDWK